jgi:uncharacterized protein (TIGR02145 family)
LAGLHKSLHLSTRLSVYLLADQVKGDNHQTQINPFYWICKPFQTTIQTNFTMKTNFLVILALAGILSSCGDDLAKSLPIVETVSFSIKDATHLSLIGNVADEGKSEVTNRGFCWALTENPTIEDFISDEAMGGPGEFSMDITVLDDNTYFIRAYATNSKGTGYGNTLTANTSAAAPVLTTRTPTEITTSSVKTGGIITSDGGSVIIAKGICWSTKPGPVVAGLHTNEGTGLEPFTIILSDLVPNQTYYIRAYASNSIRTSYGEETNFKTATGMTGTFVDPRDNHVYNWIEYNQKAWMIENLAYLPAVSPSSDYSSVYEHFYVNEYQGNSVSAAKATTDYQVYGVLYNWPAANIACPDGWHLPSDEDWKSLEKCLGMSAAELDLIGFRESGIVGASLKETGFRHWMGENLGSTNSSGFTALPGGQRISTGYEMPGFRAMFWTSTQNDNNTALYRQLYFYDYGVYRNTLGKQSGFSVRCLRD